MSTRLKIKGGPVANNMKVIQVLEDGTEVELQGLTSVTISGIKLGEKIVVSLTMCNVELDMDIEAEV